MVRTWFIGLMWMLAIVFVASSACAQSDGTVLAEGGFNVDLVTGPVLGSGQITGLGGAYSAIATGIDGAAWNPASYASRTLWGTSWFDWDLSLSVNPGTVGAVDFDNDGRSDSWRSDTTMSGAGEQRFQYASVGLNLQFGALGIGLLARGETYTIDLPDTDINTVVSLVTYHYGAGYTLADGDIVLGLGARTAALSIDAPQATAGTGTAMVQDQLVDFTGTNLEAGLLVRLVGQPWRLGAAARLPVVSVLPTDSTQPVTGVAALPKEVRLPWEIQVGFAWQLGERPLNRRWANPHVVRDQLQAAMLQRRRDRAQLQWESEQRDAAAISGRAPLQAAAVDGLRIVGTPANPEWWKLEDARRDDEEADLRAELRTAERRRELAVRNLSRDYVLLTSELVLVGRTDNGVGVESFLSGIRQTSGNRISAGFRFGAELEPIAHWVKLRGGGYLEPTRYSVGHYRAHGTLGFDVRLFDWDLFGWLTPFTVRTGATLDAATRYTSFGINLGVWH